ncbi:hypothetical protein V2J09_005285 [Rumex salicifolius]
MENLEPYVEDPPHTSSPNPQSSILSPDQRLHNLIAQAPLLLINIHKPLLTPANPARLTSRRRLVDGGKGRAGAVAYAARLAIRAIFCSIDSRR